MSHGMIRIYKTEGHAYKAEVQIDEQTNEATLSMDDHVVATFQYGGSGTTKVHTIDEKAVLDLVSDLIFYHKQK